MHIEPVDGWKEAAKVTRLLGVLLLVAVVAGLAFPTPWSPKTAAPGVTGPARSAKLDYGGLAKTDPAADGKAGTVATADKAVADGASQKAEPSVGDDAKAIAEATPKPISHPEPQAREISKKQGEHETPALATSARGSWSSLLTVD